MSIGESIRFFRLQKQLSLTKLATRCGITASYRLLLNAALNRIRP